MQWQVPINADDANDQASNARQCQVRAMRASVQDNLRKRFRNGRQHLTKQSHSLSATRSIASSINDGLLWEALAAPVMQKEGWRKLS